MFRSVKQKFGGSGKAKPQQQAARDEPAPQLQNNSSQRPAPSLGPSTSGRSSGSSLARSNSQAPAHRIPQPSSLDLQTAQQYYAYPLPAFRDVPAAQNQALFVRKLHLCAFTFDFTDQSKNVREKEMKRQALLDLADYVNSG